ncbi:hypothetical protein PUN28_007920 [Cardiocondyla obscurior]|uniref:Uncharacterized protein n=1 Tax=Cardiocondyla obscurior TaxID=286306 RepID=A0AAW2G1A2_9HYME
MEIRNSRQIQIKNKLMLSCRCVIIGCQQLINSSVIRAKRKKREKKKKKPCRGDFIVSRLSSLPSDNLSSVTDAVRGFV